MKWMKMLLIAFALVVGSSAIAAAQEGYGGWQDRSWQRDHDRNDRASQWGYQRDRDRDYRRGDGDYDEDDGYYRNQGVYGRNNQNPYYNQGMQEARRNGFQYGLHDGEIDRREGRSYRATTNESYRKATIGYVKAYGDKDRYRKVFRQAYERAYQRAYGPGAYRGQIGRVPWGR